MDVIELVYAQVVLHDGGDVASYPMDVGVDGQMRVRVRDAAKDWLAAVEVVIGY